MIEDCLMVFRRAVSESESEKEMAIHGRVHPECVNAGNPYHECGAICLEMISQGVTRKPKSRRKSGIKRGGAKQAHKFRNPNYGEERRAPNPNCPKSVNPFHDCGKNCTEDYPSNPQDIYEDPRSFILGAPVSKIRKEIKALSQPNSPQGAAKPVYLGVVASPRSPLSSRDSNKKSVDSDGGRSSTLCELLRHQQFEGTRSGNMSHESATIVEVTNNGSSSSQSNRKTVDLDTSRSGTLSHRELDEIRSRNRSLEIREVTNNASSSPNPNRKSVDSDTSRFTTLSRRQLDETRSRDLSLEIPEVTTNNASSPPKSNTNPNRKSIDFDTSMMSTTLSHQQFDETHSRDLSRESATNMEVTNNASSSSKSAAALYQQQFDKILSRDPSHESPIITQETNNDPIIPVGRYHVRAGIAPTLSSILDKYGDIAENCILESVSVISYVLECLCYLLRGIQSLTNSKPKVKELLAVLKDVESVGIDVSWLRDEVVIVNIQQQAECHLAIELVRRELESLMADLDSKEKDLAEAAAKVERLKVGLEELEGESLRLKEAVSCSWSLVEKFHGLGDSIL
ncbi:hypothetical protein LINPERHAP1_LOCUS3493 [Linum perenne]